MTKITPNELNVWRKGHPNTAKKKSEGIHQTFAMDNIEFLFWMQGVIMMKWPVNT